MTERNTWPARRARAAAILALAAALAAPSISQARDGQIDVRPTGAATFTISASGSYVLVDNVTVASNSVDAISITANDVTLDLNGHTISGPGNGTGRGINGLNRSRVTIFNGTITGFGSNGIDVSGSGAIARIHDVKATGCGAYGIFTSTDAILENCVCDANNLAGNAAGISVGARTYARNCSACSNVAGVVGTSSAGILCAADCTLTGNICSANAANGSNPSLLTAYGINAGAGSTISGNICNNNASPAFVGAGINTGSNCMITGNNCIGNTGNSSGEGINGSSSCTILNNTCNGNTGNGGAGAGFGIVAVTSLVAHNTCINNAGLGANFGNGIRASGQVTDNVCGGNNGGPTSTIGGTGIEAIGVDTIVARNTCYGNGASSTGSAVGIKVSSARCVIRDNICNSQTAAVTGTTRGIFVGANDCTIDANACSSNSGGGANFGIFVNTGVTGCVVSRNNTQGNASGGIGFGSAGSANRAELNRSHDAAISNPPTSVGLAGTDFANLTF